MIHPLAALLCLLVTGSAAGHAQAVFTEEQTAAGEVAYNRHCADCHHTRLHGTGHGSELIGRGFLSRWESRSTTELFDSISMLMPAGAPGSLTRSDYRNVLAYLLYRNGARAGETPFDPETPVPIGRVLQGEAWVPPQAPEGATESWEGAGSIAEAARQASGFVNREVQDFAPVSVEMLAEPPAQDWLSWRRTLDGQGHSPLAGINRNNVEDLRLAWVLAMAEGSNQATPLVHDGIMYLTHPGNVIQALDAADGDVIWEYRYAFPPASKTLGGPTRNIAILGRLLFMATYDAALVAVDAVTGEQVWRTVKADWRQGYTHTSGPIIAGGVVVSGINGCERFKPGGCFITGHDPATGRELWRTSTIALSGDPNFDSWGNVPAELRAGSDTWIPGSYDPKLGLFYIGTSQAKPWVAASRGMSPLDAALYTNSTLALDPLTGRLAWYYQHIPGESLDMEVGFERVLVDLEGRQLLVTIGKDGILWLLDRQTGQFVDFTPTLFQNVFVTMDKATGRLAYRPDIVAAKVGEPVSACPGIYGGHNWQATAYDPLGKALIIPLHQLCVEMTGRQVEMNEGGGGYGGDSRMFPMPDADGMLGRLSAWDLATMQEKWSHQQREMFLTGVLTTAGGLAFVGDLGRYFKAFDLETGRQLWAARLGAALHGFPISYAVDGTQYVAVPTGMGVFKLVTAMQTPELYQPNGGNALYVFRLAE